MESLVAWGKFTRTIANQGVIDKHATLLSVRSFYLGLLILAQNQASGKEGANALRRGYPSGVELVVVAEKGENVGAGSIHRQFF